MKHSTQQDYVLLDRHEQEHAASVAGRLLSALSQLKHGFGGYQIDRFTHSLQSAARAEADGADDEWVVAALLHDIGDDVAPLNHSYFSAAVLTPYVRDEAH